LAARRPLTQLDGGTFITDGGMETTLIFRDGLELPDFASFVLLDDPEGLYALWAYYASYVAAAERHGAGIVLDTPTWRANAHWGARLGYDAEALDDVNRRASRSSRRSARRREASRCSSAAASDRGGTATSSAKR
jgi:homocysteine S-methyltransferase